MKRFQLSWLLGFGIFSLGAFVFILSILVVDILTRISDFDYSTLELPYYLGMIIFMIYCIILYKRLMNRIHRTQFVKLADMLNGQIHESFFKITLVTEDIDLENNFFDFHINFKNISTPTIFAIRITKDWQIQISGLNELENERYKNNLEENLIRIRSSGFDVWKILTLKNDIRSFEFYNYHLNAEKMKVFIQDMKAILNYKS
ncbi:hypothetical protein [[Eubacterium] cellulosolvens]